MSDGLSKYHRIKDRLAALSAQFRAYKNELRKCKSFIQNSNLIGKTDDNHGDLIKIHNDAECSRADRKHSGELAGTLIEVRMGKILPIEGADRIEATLKAWENAPPESKRKARTSSGQTDTKTDTGKKPKKKTEANAAVRVCGLYVKKELKADPTASRSQLVKDWIESKNGKWEDKDLSYEYIYRQLTAHRELWKPTATVRT